MLQYLPIISTIIDRIFPDEEKNIKAKAELQAILAQQAAAEMEAKSKVVVAEAKGENWMQRNWRPCLMFLFMFILAFNFIFAPLVSMFGVTITTLPIPDHMWMLLTVGVGGYIGSRGYEKVTRIKNEKDIFDALREYKGYLTQEDVNNVNSIIKE